MVHGRGLRGRGGGPVGDLDRAGDGTFGLAAPEVYLLLVGDRGWTPDRYETWLGAATQLIRGLLA